MSKYGCTFCLINCFLVYTLTSDGDLGSVSGHVLAESGEPVASASVYLEAVHTPSLSRPSISKTNQEGRYSMEGVHPGTYALHAFKPDAGYPDIVFAFNLSADQKLRELTVAQGQHLEGIDIRLGPKPGLLRFHVTDARTGLSLQSVDYELCQVHRPDWCLRGGAPGQTEFSVPTTEITIQVTSKGYQKLRYVQNGKTSISLASGEQREIFVSLKPVGRFAQP